MSARLDVVRGEASDEIQSLLTIEGAEEWRGCEQVLQEALAGELVEGSSDSVDVGSRSLQGCPTELQEVRVVLRNHRSAARLGGD